MANGTAGYGYSFLCSGTGYLGPRASDSGTVTITPAAVAQTSEPSSIALLGTGLLGVAGVLRKRIA